MKQVDIQQLDPMTQRVFIEIRRYKAMPFLELAAVTGIRGIELKNIVDSLVRRGLVTVLLC